MRKKIITKISEGLGNQLFMYANSYCLSKKNNLDFLIDPFSGYYQKKHMYSFFLIDLIFRPQMPLKAM